MKRKTTLLVIKNKERITVGDEIFICKPECDPNEYIKGDECLQRCQKDLNYIGMLINVKIVVEMKVYQCYIIVLKILYFSLKLSNI